MDVAKAIALETDAVDETDVAEASAPKEDLNEFAETCVGEVSIPEPDWDVEGPQLGHQSTRRSQRRHRDIEQITEEEDDELERHAQLVKTITNHIEEPSKYWRPSYMCHWLKNVGGEVADA